ncbi:MAG: hypothetical protein AUK44_08005 [Porphyromonadaceae bacterium CG2_30_38_12]|nr:MAG: hypothetical protein AUK44_08005 [Porphyromonadaceae bacterium CG2_30_38_12]
MKTNILLLVAFFVGSIQAEDKSELSLSLGADLTTSYLWRGLPQGTLPALQPWGELSYKGFTLGTWGSYELAGGFKEIDMYAKYTLKAFTLQFIDLYFPDYVGLNPDFFNFKKAETGHAAELGVSYNGSEKIPFTVYGGMIIYGAAVDPNASNASELNKSAYVEVNYLGTLNDIKYNIFTGFTPTESLLYGSSQFAFIHVGVSAQKTLKITDFFSLPLKLTLAANPNSNKFYMAFAISL